MDTTVKATRSRIASHKHNERSIFLLNKGRENAPRIHHHRPHLRLLFWTLWLSHISPQSTLTSPFGKRRNSFAWQPRYDKLHRQNETWRLSSAAITSFSWPCRQTHCARIVASQCITDKGPRFPQLNLTWSRDFLPTQGELFKALISLAHLIWSMFRLSYP